MNIWFTLPNDSQLFWWIFNLSSGFCLAKPTNQPKHSPTQPQLQPEPEPEPELERNATESKGNESFGLKLFKYS